MQIWFLAGGVVTILLGVGSFFVPAILSLEDGATDATVEDTGRGMVAAVQERQVEVSPSVTAQV